MTVSENTYFMLYENGFELKKTALLALEKGIFFYCFTPEEIDWANETVRGYCLDARSESWISKTMPFPSILYDQATYPLHPEKRKLSKEVNLRMREEKPSMPVLNSKRFFGKWETCEALHFFGETRSFLPHTKKLTPLNLAAMLEQKQTIFAKSEYGSYGWSVLQLQKKEGEIISCRYGGEKVWEEKFQGIISLYRFLREKLGGKAALQQAVNLAKVENKVFDMRLLAQKGYSGQWSLTCVSLRLSPERAVATNVSLGAEEIIITQKDRMPHPALDWQQLEQFSRKVLLALEASFGRLGEIGIDAALDNDGRLWLLEANSKPNTAEYRHVTGKEVCSTIYGRPLDYAAFLASETIHPLLM